MNNNMEYKFLDQINFPDDLRNYKVNDLKSIAKELRHNTPENQYKQIQEGNGYGCPIYL